MFEKFLKLTPKSEIKQQQNYQSKVIKQEQDFNREQNIMTNELNPEADHSYYQHQQDRSDLLRWQQDLNDELFELIMILRGYAKTEEDKFVKVRERALCNKKFIYDVVIPQCRPFLSRNLINSNINDERIYFMLRTTMNTIVNSMADSFQVSRSSYDIKFTDFDLILQLIKNTIVPSPFRALNGWTKKMDGTIHKSIEASNPSNQESTQNKAGLFNFK